MKYLSIAAMFRDEATCLREWLLFHLINGVDYFRLYDNGSTDDFLGAVHDLVDARIVDLVRWEDRTDQSQQNMYHHAIESLKGRSRWVAFIDVDEFLFSPAAPKLCQVLGDFERFPGVVVNWQIYGSCGLEQREGLVLDSFIRRAPRGYFRNFRVKSVVDPNQVESALGAHFFSYTAGRRAVDECGEPVDVVSRKDLRDCIQDRDPMAARFSTRPAVTVDRLRINHYAVKSRTEYRAKLKRFADRSYVKDRFREYWEIHDRNDVEDQILLPSAKVLSQLMALELDDCGLFT